MKFRDSMSSVTLALEGIIDLNYVRITGVERHPQLWEDTSVDSTIHPEPCPTSTRGGA